jgi:mRNA degradation ribonuclease J1/J2
MRKRSKYKPKGVRLDNMLWVTSGMKKVSQVEDAGVMLKIKNHMAMANLVQGRGTREDVDMMIAAMNVTEAFAIHGKGKDWKPEIRAAQDALVTMARRGVERGDKFIFMGEEMQAINLAMEVHDVQLDEATVSELEQALQLVEREVRAKRARAIVTKE